MGRNGAGQDDPDQDPRRRRPARVRQVLTTGEVGYLPQDPRIGNPEVLARDRILSARGLDDVVRRLREAEAEMGSEDADVARAGDEALLAGRRRAARRRWVRRRVRGGADRAQPRASRTGCSAQPLKHPVRWPAPPGRAGPDPVLRRRDAAARRADQPPRRRLDRLAARLPQGAQGRPGRDQPRQRRCSSRRSTRCCTSTPTGPRSTSTTWAGRPTCSSARPTRSAASASGPTPRRRPTTLIDQANKMRAKATKAQAAQ